MAVSRLRLLGGFACETCGSALQLPVGTQRLLAFLALRGPSHRALVAGSLWPEVPEHQALASLRTGVWRMNKAVAGLLECDGAALRVSQETSVDSREQEAFAIRLLGNQAGDDALDDELDSLWLGELLPGWYDDWVVFERERLSQLRLHALERAAQVLTRRHRLDAALQLALEAVRTEPLRESATAVLMSVYIAEGNVSDALHQYDAFRELLLRELGLDPSPTLCELLPCECRAAR